MVGRKKMMNVERVVGMGLGMIFWGLGVCGGGMGINCVGEKGKLRGRMVIIMGGGGWGKKRGVVKLEKKG
ncbi:hypothetical protein, partial [Bacillus thuringiensis]|uniref:hypothetical protein n=1 Tax=Bacillus thuringiensis TaxID=1428 RepID=UPI0011A10389